MSKFPQEGSPIAPVQPWAYLSQDEEQTLRLFIKNWMADLPEEYRSAIAAWNALKDRERGAVETPPLPEGIHARLLKLIHHHLLPVGNEGLRSTFELERLISGDRNAEEEAIHATAAWWLHKELGKKQNALSDKSIEGLISRCADEVNLVLVVVYQDVARERYIQGDPLWVKLINRLAKDVLLKSYLNRNHRLKSKLEELSAEKRDTSIAYIELSVMGFSVTKTDRDASEPRYDPGQLRFTPRWDARQRLDRKAAFCYLLRAISGYRLLQLDPKKKLTAQPSPQQVTEEPSAKKSTGDISPKSNPTGLDPSCWLYPDSCDNSADWKARSCRRCSHGLPSRDCAIKFRIINFLYVEYDRGKVGIAYPCRTNDSTNERKWETIFRLLEEIRKCRVEGTEPRCGPLVEAVVTRLQDLQRGLSKEELKRFFDGPPAALKGPSVALKGFSAAPKQYFLRQRREIKCRTDRCKKDVG